MVFWIKKSCMAVPHRIKNQRFPIDGRKVRNSFIKNVIPFGR